MAWSEEGGDRVEGGGAAPVGGMDGATVVAHLYRTEYAAMVRLAGLLTGERDLGEEIAQDAFARLFEVAARVDNPSAYLRTTVVNLSRSKIRRFVIRRRHLPAAPAASPSPEAGVASRLDLRMALAKLPARQREAVVLRYYGDLTDNQVSAAMGISAGAVKSHLHRAVAALSSGLEDRR